MKIDRKNIWKYIFSCLISLYLLSSCDTRPKFYLTSSSPPTSALYDSARGLTKAKAYEEAMMFLDSASKISEATKDSLSLAPIYHLQGFVNRRLGKTHQALLNYYQALELFEKTDDSRAIGELLNSIGRIYEDNHEFEQALYHYLQAYELLRVREKMGISVLNNIGIVYKKLGEYDQALLNYHTAFKSDLVSGDSVRKANLLNNIGEAYMLKKEYEKAEEAYHEALSLYRGTGDEKKTAYVMNNLGLVHKEIGQVDKALSFLNESIALHEKYNTPYLIDSYNNVIELYSRKGDINTALSYVNKAESLSVGNVEEYSNTIYLKADLLERQGKVQMALDHIKKSKSLIDSIVDKRVAVKVIEVENQALMKKVEEKIHLIKIERENALKDSLLESKDRFIQWVSSSSIAVIIFLVVLFFLYRRLRVVNVTLNNLIEDGAHTMSNQLQGVECGAIELKHGPVPLAPPQVRSVALIENSSKAMRRLIDSFTGTKDKTKIVTKIHRPENSIDQILELYRGMAMTREMKIETVIESEAMILVKPEEYEHAIGNLVSNAIKYAPEKSTITIHLYDKEEEVYLAVLDEGEGIPADKQHKLFKKRMKLHRKKGIVSNGLGLYFARKNIKAMNGKLWYEDRPGGGAAFIIAFFKADGA